MLFDKFQNNLNQLVSYNFPRAIAVSVSGGSDSLALLFLVNEWRIQYNLAIDVFTVNHHLRDESESECNYVKDLSTKLNCECTILNWYPRGNFSNLQACARKGRYDLITTACREKNIPVILTGHHLDDYLENFLIRHQRKSGEFGLSSSNIHFYNNIKIIRPLYNINKVSLTEYLVSKKITWVEDVSNLSDKYLRSKIRNVLTNAPITFKLDILKKQEEINETVKELKQILIRAIAETCMISEYGFTIINLKLLKNFPSVIILQLLSYILTITGGKNHIPRGRGVELLVNLISIKDDFINNLHGCSIKKLSDKIIILREFGLHAPDSVTLKQDIVWDNRFIIRNCPEIHGGYITYLNKSDYTEIKDHICMQQLKKISVNNHKKILFTLPVIKKLEKIIAIPHISLYNDKRLETKITISYHPEFISRFIHLT